MHKLPAKFMQPLVADAEMVSDLMNDGDPYFVDHVIDRVADLQNLVTVDRNAIGKDARVPIAALGERYAVVETEQPGLRRVVLDNTYLTRAARSYVVDTAGRHGVAARCVWLDTPLAQAQVNLVERLLERFGSLPPPEELRALARRGAGVHAPTTQMRALRELEPPSPDEGFARVEPLPFTRSAMLGRAGVFVAAAALEQPGWKRALDQGDRDAPHLVFDWKPDGAPDALAAAAARLSSEVSGPVETALCPHAAGPPSCWCRPPLPGLPLAFARAHGLDPARSILVGTGPAHRTLATALGARYIPI